MSERQLKFLDTFIHLTLNTLNNASIIKRQLENKLIVKVRDTSMNG